MKKALMLLPVLPFLAFLSACGETHVDRIKPPANRMTCAAQPVPPAGDSDREVAGFIVGLIEAGQDCRNAVAWIRDWAKEP